MTILLKRLALASLCAFSMGLVACGGGGSGGTGATTSSTPSTSSSTSITAIASTTSAIDPKFVLFSPSAATLDAKKANSTLAFAITGLPNVNANQGCAVTISNSTVYEQAHTVVFAAAGVTEAEQQEAAEYAEAAVLDIRASFPIAGTPTTIGFNNVKVFICVQKENWNNVVDELGAAIPLAGSGGRIVVLGSNTFFSEVRTATKVTRSTLDAGSGQNFQSFYRRLLAHETVHVFQQSTSGLKTDRWMTEGVATYFEFGKSLHSVATVTAWITSDNPLNANAVNSLVNYDSAAAVMAYLFAPTGANNPLSAYTAMLYKMKQTEDQCYPIVKSVSVCPATTAQYEAYRANAFITAFESSFKEKDGTSMRLYSGTNNLKSTLASRIAAFW